MTYLANDNAHSTHSGSTVPDIPLAHRASQNCRYRSYSSSFLSRRYPPFRGDFSGEAHFRVAGFRSEPSAGLFGLVVKVLVKPKEIAKGISVFKKMNQPGPKLFLLTRLASSSMLVVSEF